MSDAELRDKGIKVRNKSKVDQKLNMANVGNQQGAILSNMKTGETITAMPIPGSKRMKDGSIKVDTQRAKLYKKQTKGALDYIIIDDDTGHAMIKTKKIGPNKWETIKGDVVEFDPESLGAAIDRLADKETPRRLSGRRLKNGGGTRAQLKAKPVRANQPSTPKRSGLRSSKLSTVSAQERKSVQRANRAAKPDISGKARQLASDSAKNNTGAFTPRARAAAAKKANREGVEAVNKVVGSKVHHGTRNITNKAVGIQTEVSWKGNPAGGRGRRIELSFRDMKGDGYDPRDVAGTKQQQKLRAAVVKDQINQALSAAKPYDTIHGSYHAGNDAGKNLNTTAAKARDRVLGQRVTGGVLKSKPTGSSGLRKFEATKFSDGTWRNIDGKRISLPDLQRELTLMIDTPVTKLGKRAGGSSSLRIRR